MYRIALANLPYPTSPDDSVMRAISAIENAARGGAKIVCFPECYVPGYRGLGHMPPPSTQAFLDRAWSEISSASGRSKIAVVLGTERPSGDKPMITALVIDETGKQLGFADKVQMDPGEEEQIYAAGTGRGVFTIGVLTFGVSICHEGWRYPETVRYAAKHGAQVVFHPHLAEEENGYRPTAFGDPNNTFHEKAMLCRAAENTIYFASVNYASAGSSTTSAVAKPNGTLLVWQPYGEAGLLFADLELAEATGFLASRCKS